MISAPQLREMSATKLDEAVDLYRLGRFDGSIYLCGYAVELALKARICDTLMWNGFPSSGSDFHDYRSLQTHNLNVLLDFSSIQDRVREDYADAWEIAETWNPEWRYLPVGNSDEEDCREMIEAVALLLEVI